MNYRLKLERPAQRFYEEQASSDEQDLLDRIFDRLEDDPLVDHENKVWFTGYLPAMCAAWIDDDFNVVYQHEVILHDDVDDERVVTVLTIRRALGFRAYR